MNEISDEILAAYLEGNATKEEIDLILSSKIGLGSLISDFNSLSALEIDEYHEKNNINIDFNPFLQGYSDTCAIKSQQLILNDFGIPCSEDDLVQYSAMRGWYNGNGTSIEDVGNLLEDAGIPCTRLCDANVFNLVKELSQGHKVIVGVDSNELWGNRFIEWLKDFFLGETPDHALLVTGIDTSDPKNIKVVVTDPGTGEFGKVYPLDQFMDAWSDASCYMCSTDIAVPVSVPGMENFDYMEGHIPEVAGMEYSQFELFNDISMGLPVAVPQIPCADGLIPNAEIMDSQMPFIQPFSGINYPIASLMDAYFGVAQNNLALTNIFMNNDELTQYLDTSIVNDFMGESFNNGLSRLSLDPCLSWENYALNNNLFGEVSNLEYSNYLNDTINSLYDFGDLVNANILDQQLFMLNYCEGFNMNFYDTFCC